MTATSDERGASRSRTFEHNTVLVAVSCLVLLVVSGWFGISTAHTVNALGPHRAVYQVTTDGRIVVDVGPLGTLQLDAPFPLGLGVRATVQEIPEDVTSLDPAATLETVSRDLDGYVQFFSSPATVIQDVATELAYDAVGRTLRAFLLLLVGASAAYLLLGPARRRELATWASRHRKTVLLGAVGAVVVGSVSVASAPRQVDVEAGRATSAIFDGTVLEGARITGRLAGLVDTYGGMALQAWRENEEFYARASDNLRLAWAERQEQAEEWERLVELLGLRDALQQQLVADPDSLVTVVLVSDLHCNVGMVPVIATAVELSGADVVFDAGDTTVNGTAVEQYCVTALARTLPDTPIVLAGGNHDSATTAEQARGVGQVVLDGSVVEVAGIRILGDVDPLATRIGAGTVSAYGETVEDASRRLAEVACAEDETVPVLLVHTPAVGEAALNSGCVSTQISGHLHRWDGPEHAGLGVRLISGSTAGAVLGGATVGPLRGTATIGVLRYAPSHGLFSDWVRIQVASDASVTVDRRTPFPLPAALLPPPPPDMDDDGAPPGAV